VKERADAGGDGAGRSTGGERRSGTGERRSAPRRERPPPEHVEEALRRSAHHARNAVAEALLAAHALLDAVALGLTGRAASATQASGARGAGPLATLSGRIEALAGLVRAEEAGLPEAWADALLDALESEIARWETRAADDRDARAVLRAFLGLREVLWELGVRGRGAGPGAARGGAARRHAGAAPRSGEAREGAPPAEADAERDSKSDEPRRRGARRRRGGRPRVRRLDVEG